MFLGVLSVFFVSMVLGFCSKNFFIFWVCMEISGLSVVVMFWKSMYSKELFFYFLITAFSGAFVLLSWMKMWWFFCCFVLLVKMGVWPFSYWVLEVCKSLKFFSSFVFLFLLKFLPFYGVFNFFSSCFFFLIFLAFVKLFGTSFSLLLEHYYAVEKVFVWMSISSMSYWIMMGIYFSFFFFLFFYLIYSMFMGFLLYSQNRNISGSFLWVLMFMMFLGGPPLIYLLLKVVFFLKLAENYFFMFVLVFGFFFQSVVLIRILMFSIYSVKKLN